MMIIFQIALTVILAMSLIAYIHQKYLWGALVVIGFISTVIVHFVMEFW